MPPPARPIDELSSEIIVCRTIGHSWDDNPNGEVDSDLFKAAHGVLMLRCVRCLMERYDYINTGMTVFARYYRKPDNWHQILGEGKRPNLRAEMFSRSLLVRQYKPRKRLRSVS